MVDWTAPKTWDSSGLTASDMNTHIRDNLLALSEPPSAVGNPDANYTTSNTAWTNVDGGDVEGVFKHTLETFGRDVTVNFVGMVGHSASVTGSVLFNISIDGAADYVVDDGITGLYTNSSATIFPISFSFVIPAADITAGTHVIRLRWKSSSASNTCTLYAGGGSAGRDVHGQFIVRESS